MDSYQAIYDAARSRIGSVNTHDVLERAALQAFDMGHARAILQEQIGAVGHEMMRPSAIYRPKISQDGDQWCALYGDDLVQGVAGFGDTPDAAMRAFDVEWWNGKTSAAIRNAKSSDAQ